MLILPLLLLMIGWSVLSVYNGQYSVSINGDA